MEATRSPHREVHHAAPESGGYPSGWPTSALMRIPDSRRTLREVRKGPNSDMATFADALRFPRRSVDCR
jgi:hypothetical protein